MNSKQRRKAYRGIDRMVGKTFEMIKPSGDVIKLVVLGRTKNVHLLSSTSDRSNFEGFAPSVHRVECRTPMGAKMSPRLSRLRLT